MYSNGLSNKNKILSEVNIPTSILNLLSKRNINTKEEIDIFFNPSLDSLHDPFLMKDMDKAVKRILEAIEKDEKIMLYGDYDADGISGVAALFLYLKNFSTKISFYIPDRDTEGYGISINSIEKAKKEEIKIIIAIDCGTKENEAIDFAKNHGIDFIICDHHILEGEKPKALSLLNPKREDCNYPNENLSGCAVGFKLIQGLSKYLKSNFDIFSLLDFVSISLVSDMIPLIKEARTMAFFGFKRIREFPRVAFKIMLNNQYSDFKIGDISYNISPKINAVGRMGHSKTAVNFLITNNYVEARKIYSTIIMYNKKRKALDDATTNDIYKTIENNIDKTLPYIFLYKENWHKGIIGIMAMKVLSKFKKTSFIITKHHDDIVVGSARSNDSFDLYNAMAMCSDILIKFGGHKQAIGFSLYKKDIPLFEKKIKEIIKDPYLSNKTHEEPLLKYDIEIKLSEINPNFISIINKFAPFGIKNKPIVFYSRNLSFTGMHRFFGKDKKNIRFGLFEKNNPKKSYDAIFHKKEILSNLRENDFDITYTIEENFWEGKKYTILKILEIKFFSNS